MFALILFSALSFGVSANDFHLKTAPNGYDSQTCTDVRISKKGSEYTYSFTLLAEIEKSFIGSILKPEKTYSKTIYDGTFSEQILDPRGTQVTLTKRGDKTTIKMAYRSDGIIEGFIVFLRSDNGTEMSSWTCVSNNPRNRFGNKVWR